MEVANAHFPQCQQLRNQNVRVHIPCSAWVDSTSILNEQQELDTRTIDMVPHDNCMSFLHMYPFNVIVAKIIWDISVRRTEFRIVYMFFWWSQLRQLQQPYTVCAYAFVNVYLIKGLLRLVMCATMIAMAVTVKGKVWVTFVSSETMEVWFLII